MPRKPYRTKIPVPEVLKTATVYPRDPDPVPAPPESTHERLAFLDTVVTALLDRLGRCAPREAKVAKEAIRMARDNVWSWCFYRGGEKEAREATHELVAMLSQRDLNRLNKPAPFRLLGEYQDLVKTMPMQAPYMRRRDWLLADGVDKEKAEELAPHKGADLVERLLAHRHNMSPSQIHKILADDTNRQKSIRKAP